MSNRRKVRPEIPARPPEYVVKAAEASRCPDCDSEITIRWYRDLGWRIAIAHDDGCVQLTWRQTHGATTSLALASTDPDRPLTAEDISRAVEFVSSATGADAVRLATGPSAGSYDRTEREALGQLLDGES